MFYLTICFSPYPILDKLFTTEIVNSIFSFLFNGKVIWHDCIFGVFCIFVMKRVIFFMSYAMKHYVELLQDILTEKMLSTSRYFDWKDTLFHTTEE